MRKDSEYWDWYYLYQELLSIDRPYLESIKETREGKGNGVRQESSLPFSLNDLAHKMASKETDSYADAKRICYSIHPKVKEMKEKHSNVIELYKCEQDEFNFSLNISLKNNREYIDSTVEADYYYIAFKDGNVIGGFATNKNGYLSGFFSLNNSYTEKLYSLMLKKAYNDAKLGLHKVNLFCTGEFLKDFYEDKGFKVTEIVKWEDKYAPYNWNYEKNGRPNLYRMEKGWYD